MDLGEYLRITDKKFTLSFNDFYYYQNGSNNFLLNTKTREKKHNIHHLNTERSLSEQLSIPIYKPLKFNTSVYDYRSWQINYVIEYDGNLVYQEKIKEGRDIPVFYLDNEYPPESPRYILFFSIQRNHSSRGRAFLSTMTQDLEYRFFDNRLILTGEPRVLNNNFSDGMRTVYINGVSTVMHDGQLIMGIDMIPPQTLEYVDITLTPELGINELSLLPTTDEQSVTNVIQDWCGLIEQY